MLEINLRIIPTIKLQGAYTFCSIHTSILVCNVNIAAFTVFLLCYIYTYANVKLSQSCSTSVIVFSHLFRSGAAFHSYWPTCNVFYSLLELVYLYINTEFYYLFIKILA